jgi:hypothetical protein
MRSSGETISVKLQLVDEVLNGGVRSQSGKLGEEDESIE